MNLRFYKNQLYFRKKIEMKKMKLLFVIVALNFACSDSNKNKNETGIESEPNADVTEITEEKADEPKIYPVSHASFVMEWGNKIWYNDPVGPAVDFENYGNPDVILISDIHGDHFSVETLQAIEGDFKIIAPQAVFDKMPTDLQEKSIIMNNDDTLSWESFEITAIPMYNITEGRLQYHPKGRGNGYVIQQQDYRMYISGDTENVDEMENLRDIDLALICMNLPYTMDIKQAAEGVLTFSPKKVIPYHYRGLKDGENHFYDVEFFERIITLENPDMKVQRLNWYPEN